MHVLALDNYSVPQSQGRVVCIAHVSPFGVIRKGHQMWKWRLIMGGVRVVPTQLYIRVPRERLPCSNVSEAKGASKLIWYSVIARDRLVKDGHGDFRGCTHPIWVG